jgi:hypothetical protein
MRKYQLHINEPCAENWDKMCLVEKGKFCSNCQKTVFDFTTANDSEIVKHIEAMNGEEFCGRFEEYQLNTWIHTSGLQNSNKQLYKILLTFLLVSVSQNVFAQEALKQETVLLQKKPDSALSLYALRSERPDVTCATAPIVIKHQENTRIIMGRARSLTSSRNPLFIVDGLPKSPSEISNIDSKTIQSVNVLIASTAIALYGSSGENGVIILVTKSVKMEKKAKMKSSK